MKGQPDPFPQYRWKVYLTVGKVPYLNLYLSLKTVPAKTTILLSGPGSLMSFMATVSADISASVWDSASHWQPWEGMALAESIIIRQLHQIHNSRHFPGSSYHSNCTANSLMIFVVWRSAKTEPPKWTWSLGARWKQIRKQAGGELIANISPMQWRALCLRRYCQTGLHTWRKDQSNSWKKYPGRRTSLI